MNQLKRLLHHLRTENNPAKWLWSEFFQRSRLGSFVTFDRGLYRIFLFPTGMTLRADIQPHAYREHEAFLLSHLRPGDMIVEVGANVGFFRLASAAIVGPTGRVTSYEAHPRTFSYLGTVEGDER